MISLLFFLFMRCHPLAIDTIFCFNNPLKICSEPLTINSINGSEWSQLVDSIFLILSAFARIVLSLQFTDLVTSSNL